jgi:hypothetical protein
MQSDLERAKRQTEELAGVARERGREQLEGAKRDVADRAERSADAVESTAEQLEQNGGGALGGYGKSLAEMMRQLAGGLRERDVDEFARELSTFARRHPGAFLAGSVALGFGISRFLKASTQRSHHDYADDVDYDEREYSGDPFIREAEAGDSPEDMTGLGSEAAPLGGTRQEDEMRTGGTL